MRQHGLWSLTAIAGKIAVYWNKPCLCRLRVAVVHQDDPNMVSKQTTSLLLSLWKVT